MKKTILLLATLSLNIAFAQDMDPRQAELRGHLDGIIARGQPVTCLESQAEVDESKVNGVFNQEVSYSLSTEEGYSEEGNEYYLVFTNILNNEKWNYFMAFENYNGAPMGKLEVKEEANKVIYTHTFNGYRTSKLILTVVDGKPVELLKKNVAAGYVVQKTVCAL